MDTQFLAEIGARASTLDEVLSSDFEDAEAIRSAEEVADIIAAWRRASADGDEALFTRRLAKDGIDPSRLSRRLRGAKPRHGAPAARWLESARWIACAFERGPTAAFLERMRSGQEHIAFDEILGGIVEEADHRIWDSNPTALERVAASARDELAIELLRSLSDLCAPVLYEEFCNLFPRRAPGDARDNGAYAAFIDAMRARGARGLFEQRPVLLRLIAVQADQWIETTREFLDRLVADWSEISPLLQSPPTRVTNSGRVGDVHNHGRAVRRVVFEGGGQIFYKPKDLSVDAAWAGIVKLLNGDGAPFSLRVPLTIAKQGYGWTEAIQHLSCTSQEELAGYFQKAGAWLCLFQLFCASDMHEQNIIACAGDPVPVDLETLLQPSSIPLVAPTDPRRAYTLAGREIERSVLATGLLPGYGKAKAGQAIGHGGLLGNSDTTRTIHWDDINGDQMRPSLVWVSEDNQNLPHRNGAYADIASFVHDVEAGYYAYAQFMLEHKRRVSVDELIAPLAALQVRKLIKNTRFYSLLLAKLRDRRLMSDGLRWSAEIDFVSRFMDWDADHDPWWPLARCERRSLAELNIPYFFTQTSSSLVQDTDGEGSEIGAESGLDGARRLLTTLDEGAIERQRTILHTSLSVVRHITVSLELRQARRRGFSTVKHQVGDRSVFRKAAQGIADQLKADAFREGVSAAWLGLDWMSDSSICQISPLGADLYNGALGISLFLAANAAINGDRESGALALAAMAGARKDLRGMNAARSSRALGVGGVTGIGSVVYGMTTAAELLEDRSLLLDAVAISRLITPELIASSEHEDIMDGAAGAVLALLKLYRRSGDESIADRARACAESLLRIKPPMKIMAAGLSHGPAGVVLALAALGAASEPNDAEPVLAAAQRWIELENTSYCDERNNWPDARASAPEKDVFWPSQWCHGAAGIGLARIAAANLTPPAHPIQIQARDDVERAVRNTIQAWPYATDSLCCGTLGGIELLAEAGQFLGRPDLTRLAEARMHEVVAEAEHHGDYLWDIGDRRVNISLFRGICGVGYTLLRRASQKTPNVLVLA